MPNRGKIWPAGIEVTAGDIQELQEAAFDINGDWAGMLGVTAATGGNSASSPLIAVASGALQVTIGGTGEMVLPNVGGQMRMVKEVPVGVFAVPTNASNAFIRLDIIYGQAQTLATNASTRQFQQTAGNPYASLGPVVVPTFSTASFAEEAQSCAYQYVQGLAGGGGIGAAPTGWVPLVQITVPASASTITQNNLAVTIPGLGGFVAQNGLRVFPIGAYGAVGDGITDDTAAFTRAIAAASTATFGVILLGAAKYLVTGSVTLAGNNVGIMGFGRQASQIIQGAQASSGFPGVVVVKGTANFLTHFSIIGYGGATPTGTAPSSSTTGTGWGVLYTGGSDHTVVFDVMCSGTYNGFGGAPNGVGSWGTVQHDACRVFNIYGQFGFFAEGSSGIATRFIVRGCEITANPAFSNAGLFVALCCDGNVTFFQSNECYVTNALNAVSVQNTYSGGSVPANVDIVKLQVGGVSSNASAISVVAGTQITIRGCNIQANSVGASGAVAIGSAVTGPVDISDSAISGQAGVGIAIAANNVIVQACRINGSGTAGIALASTVTAEVTIQNCKIGVAQGGSATQTRGIDLSALTNGTDFIVITNNDLWGNSSGAVNMPTINFLGAHCRLSPNAGWWVAPLSVTAALAPSTTVYQNPYGKDAQLIVVPGASSITLATLTYPSGSGIAGAQTIWSGSQTGAAPITFFWPAGTGIALTFTLSLTSATMVPL